MMGGAGGSDFSSWDRAKYDRLRREAENRTKDEEQETKINHHLRNLLASINDRDTDTVSQRLSEIEEALGDRIKGLDTTLFGGSVAKHTYVDGLSDIDALVLLDVGSIGDKNPKRLLGDFERTLKSTLSRAEVTSISKGTLAVTVTYRDGAEIQLLPAFRRGARFAISNTKGSGWTVIDPRAFTQALTRANKRLGRMLVPTVKLAKSVISDFPAKRQLSGYHVEALAVRVFRGYKGDTSLKAMLSHFFEKASAAVKKPLPDPTGQSQAIDASLGPQGSLERRLASDSLGRVARRMRAARSLKQWREILGEKP